MIHSESKHLSPRSRFLRINECVCMWGVDACVCGHIHVCVATGVVI